MKLDMDSDGIHGTLELGNNRMRVVLETVDIGYDGDDRTNRYAPQTGPNSITMQLRVTGQITQVIAVPRPTPPVQFVGGWSMGHGSRVERLAFNSMTNSLYGHAAAHPIVPSVIPPAPVPAPDEPLPLRTIELED